MSESVLNKKDLIMIRDGVEDDLNLIMSTWLKGLRYGNDWFELIEATAYYSNYNRLLESILKHQNTQVKVACLKDSPDVILGYCVYRDSILDFVYCKKAWRNIGIAKSLVPNSINTVSHVTDIGRNILKKHPGIKFNPFV